MGENRQSCEATKTVDVFATVHQDGIIAMKEVIQHAKNNGVKQGYKLQIIGQSAFHACFNSDETSTKSVVDESHKSVSFDTFERVPSEDEFDAPDYASVRLNASENNRSSGSSSSSSARNNNAYTSAKLASLRYLDFDDALGTFLKMFLTDDLSVITSQRLSLTDRISLRRLEIPCRGIECTHIQCFDYESYLHINKDSFPSFFGCPLCERKCNPSKLYVDPITVALLAMFPPHIESFTVSQEGIVQPYIETLASVATVSASTTVVEIIDSSSDEADDQSDQPGALLNSVSIKQRSTEFKKASESIVQSFFVGHLKNIILSSKSLLGAYASVSLKTLLKPSVDDMNYAASMCDPKVLVRQSMKRGNIEGKSVFMPTRIHVCVSILENERPFICDTPAQLLDLFKFIELSNAIYDDVVNTYAPLQQSIELMKPLAAVLLDVFPLSDTIAGYIVNQQLINLRNKQWPKERAAKRDPFTSKYVPRYRADSIFTYENVETSVDDGSFDNWMDRLYDQLDSSGTVQRNFLNTGHGKENDAVAAYIQEVGESSSSDDTELNTDINTHTSFSRFTASSREENGSYSADKQKAFHIAAQRGNLVEIMALSRSGADVNAPDKDGDTPMHLAAAGGKVDIVNALGALGADVNAPDTDGVAPLIMAAFHGHVDVVIALGMIGADVNTSTVDGSTPMLTAAQQGHVEVVNALAALGADVNSANNDGNTPLHFSAAEGMVDIVNALGALGADVNAPDKDGDTPMHLAAAEGHVDVVIALCALGANVDATNKYGLIPLMTAKQRGHVDVLSALGVVSGQQKLAAAATTSSKQSCPPIKSSESNLLYADFRIKHEQQHQRQQQYEDVNQDHKSKSRQSLIDFDSPLLNPSPPLPPPPPPVPRVPLVTANESVECVTATATVTAAAAAAAASVLQLDKNLPKPNKNVTKVPCADHISRKERKRLLKARVTEAWEKTKAAAVAAAVQKAVDAMGNSSTDIINEGTTRSTVTSSIRPSNQVVIVAPSEKDLSKKIKPYSSNNLSSINKMNSSSSGSRGYSSSSNALKISDSTHILHNKVLDKSNAVAMAVALAMSTISAGCTDISDSKNRESQGQNAPDASRVIVSSSSCRIMENNTNLRMSNSKKKHFYAINDGDESSKPEVYDLMRNDDRKTNIARMNGSPLSSSHSSNCSPSVAQSAAPVALVRPLTLSTHQIVASIDKNANGSRTNSKCSSSNSDSNKSSDRSCSNESSNISTKKRSQQFDLDENELSKSKVRDLPGGESRKPKAPRVNVSFSSSSSHFYSAPATTAVARSPLHQPRRGGGGNTTCGRPGHGPPQASSSSLALSSSSSAVRAAEKPAAAPSLSQMLLAQFSDI